MEVFKKIILMASCCFLFSSPVSALSFTDGDYWPFPLGTECPFAWNFVSSIDWQLELKDETVNVSFYISEENDGYMRIITVVYDDDWDLIAFGNEMYIERSFILDLQMLDLRDNKKFTVSLRLYDNASKASSEGGSFMGPPMNGSQMCKNMSETTLAATVISNCNSSSCLESHKNQIMSRRNP